MLYVVPTPIGNLEDITLRAIQTLKDVDFIYAEDTRTSGVLLKHYSIDTHMRSFHAFNEHKIVQQIVQDILGGMQVALISDAGTPAISDPGYLLVRAAVAAGVKVSCLPGPTAFVPALVSSGIPCDKFYFEGFLPHKKGRQTRFIHLNALKTTIVLYESTHRLVKCIKEIVTYFGSDTVICISKEISKKFEKHFTGSAAECLNYFTTQGNIKGEFVIIIDGAGHCNPASNPLYYEEE